MYRLPILTRLRRQCPIVVVREPSDRPPSGSDALPSSPFLDDDGSLQWSVLTDTHTVSEIARYCSPAVHPAAFQVAAGAYLQIFEDLLTGSTYRTEDDLRTEPMLDFADRCQTLAAAADDPRALQLMQLNWLGFAVGSSQSPRACLALYRLFLSWGVPESAAVALLEPGIHDLHTQVDDEAAFREHVEAWPPAGDCELAEHPLSNLFAGLDCVLQVAVSLLQNITHHDPALALDFVYRARYWSQRCRDVLSEVPAAAPWTSSVALEQCLAQLEHAALAAPIRPLEGFFGLPMAYPLPRIRLSERLSAVYTGRTVSPFVEHDCFSFDRLAGAAEVPLEQFLAEDDELLRVVIDAGGIRADFQALAEGYYDQLEALKSDESRDEWDEGKSILFLRALTAQALAVVYQRSRESSADLFALLAQYAKSEEQDHGVSAATALLVVVPLVAVIDDAVRVSVDGEAVQIECWLEAFRSSIPEEQAIARPYLQQTRYAWIQLCRLLTEGRPVLLDLADVTGRAELLRWVDDRVEDLLALADVPVMPILLGGDCDEYLRQLPQARRRFLIAAKELDAQAVAPVESGGRTTPSEGGRPGQKVSEDKGPAARASTPDTARLQVIDPAVMASYADTRTIKENWSVKKAEQLKAGLALLPARPDGIRQLRLEFPWFADLLDFVELWLTRDAALGKSACQLPPLLLVGGYGVGKTYFSRRLAETQGLPFRLLPAGGSSDNRQLMGTSRGWGTAFPALPVDFMAESGVANGLVLVDEVDKESDDRRNGRMSDTLLQLLEPANAKTFMDPFLGCPVDCRSLQWILTANSLVGVNKALLSRVRLFSVRPPGREHFPRLAQQIRLGFAREHQVDVRWLPALDGHDLEQIHKHCRSVREVRQITEWILTRKIVDEGGRAVVN